MSFEDNVWNDLIVQSYHLGRFMHRYEEKEVKRCTRLNATTQLIKTEIQKKDFVYIQLESKDVGFYTPQLVLDTAIFSRLYNNPFTSIYDYFLVAKNCIGVYEEGTYFSYSEEENRRCYHFNCNLPNNRNIKFNFVIDFDLQ